MSVDGFVSSLERRLGELNEQMAQIIKKDGGARVPGHMRKQTAEASKIREALFKARRPGISA